MFGFSRIKTVKGKFDPISMIPFRFFDGEDEGAGGGSPAAIADEGADVGGDDLGLNGMPKEVQDLIIEGDDEVRDVRDSARAMRNKKGSGKKALKTHEAEPPIEDEEIDEPESKGKEKQAVSEEEEPGDDKGAEGADGDDFEALDFTDDVIPGIKGEDLKRLGKDGVEALAEFYEKHTSESTKVQELEATVKKLRADPIIKAREQMIESGRDYTIRQISNEEMNYAKKMVVNALKTKYSFLDEEADDAFQEMWNVLKPGFEKIAKESAQDMLNLGIKETHAKQQEEQTVMTSLGHFMGLGKFNKSLEIKETDPSKLFTYTGKGTFKVNESHPEAGKVAQIIPVMEALGKTGASYEQVNKMVEDFGLDAVYALAAKKLGLPVAINSKERDNKIRSDERKRFMNIFVKGSATDGLPVDGSGSAVSSKSKEKGNVVNGIDMDKIIDDPDYIDEVIARKPQDEKWTDIVFDVKAQAVARRRQKAAEKNKRK